MAERWTPKPDSPAAILDETEYLRRCAEDLQKREAPKRQPAPDVVTRSQLDATIERLCATIGKAVRKMVMDPLVARISQLEAERGLKYLGPWKIGTTYKAGEFVSYAGGIWHCKQHTGTRPNKCPEAWQLAVKSGEAKR